jgi:arylsulfatase A-like enzyme
MVSPRILRAAVTAWWIAVVAGLPACRRDDEPPKQPSSSLAQFQDRLTPGDLKGWNLLLVTLDTVRVDHIGCYGYARAETPTIDSLAARGARFDHAVADVPSTLPSHCTMMTGLEAPNHGARTNGHFTLGPEITTLAEVLKEQGYATSAFVATYVLNRRFGLAQGFDTYDDFEAEAVGASGQRRADYITDAVIGWLERQRQSSSESPFFLWAHYFDPHEPYDPPGEYAKRFADSPYDGEIAYTDAHLGRLLEYLEDKKTLERTLVVLTADHGEGLGEHGEPTHSRLIYDTTIRVPLILACPQLHDASCRVDDVTVGTIDIMPTVLSLLGIETDLKMDGVDLVTATISPDRAMYIETMSPMVYHGWASLHGLRRIDAKYILAPTPEYYELRNDPDELRNLLEGNCPVHTELASRLDDYLGRRTSTEDVLTQAGSPPSSTVQRLAALGYVATASPGDTPPLRRQDPKDMVPIFQALKKRDPVEIHAAARETVEDASADRGARRRAVILAQAAHEKARENAAHVATLGIAQYQVGDYAAAAETLAQARKMSARSNKNVAPEIVACHALALHHLGRVDQARKELGRLHTALNQTGQRTSELARRLVSEAEATIP